MYDLRIGDLDAPRAAIEVVSAVDSAYFELSAIALRDGPREWGLTRDWAVVITPSARMRRVDRELPAILNELETRGLVTSLIDVARLRSQDRRLHGLLAPLDVVALDPGKPRGEGRVRFAIDGGGGLMDTRGDVLSSWVGRWLAEPPRQDVRTKLRLARARERHVFIPVASRGAPWIVESYLITWLGSERTLPTEQPQLPDPITHVWVASTVAQHGVKWDGESWSWFDSTVDGRS